VLHQPVADLFTNAIVGATVALRSLADVWTVSSYPTGVVELPALVDAADSPSAVAFFVAPNARPLATLVM
jgi:hypothetical protein